MVITDKYILFWKGFLSNWFPSNFVVDGVTYGCGEQYMMHQKALLFNDVETAQEIMETNDPKMQKALGRTVRKFDPIVWDDKCLSIMEKGLYYKFMQNDVLKEKLLKYGLLTFVEASPFDNIWGIGLYEDDPDAQDETKWKGKNYLGKVITNVRDRILKEEK